MNLLDVSVLIALIDQEHESHETAKSWFASAQAQGWATCPITENGVLRIVGASAYPNPVGSLQTVVSIVRALRNLPGHVFWPDQISVFENTRFDFNQLKTSAQITDAYLLALAISRGAMFVTFDKRIRVEAVPGGTEALHILTR